MKLSSILNDLTYNYHKDTEIFNAILIEDISYNSSKCSDNSIFIAIKGETVDGHKYASDAYSRGCKVFVLQDDIELPDDAIKIFVDDSRIALSKMSSNFFGEPSKQLTVIGITGTKGKTTVTNYISTVLNKAGINTGVIGTNGAFFNGIKETTVNTTPESYELHRILRRMVDNGVKCVAMEVSSGGLMMNRVKDIDFDIALFSNISPDHIGPKEHPTFEHYLNCKLQLFKLSKFGIVNADADFSENVIESATCPTYTFSIDKPSDLQAENIKYSNSLDALGVNFNYKTATSSLPCYICSPGTFSIYNALSVIAVCKHLKIDHETMVNALKDATVDGRVQVLPILPYATVIVDYAHNGVSLENILTTLKQYNPKRLICLFGSVGGRTELRRKELGDVAAKECDFCILTSDNPDNESPMQIINDIEKSFINSKCTYIKEPDREVAIRQAIRLAEEGDIILFAGKGHEKYQLVNGEKIPFNEAKIAEDEARKVIISRELNNVSI